MTDEKTQQPIGVASDLNAELGMAEYIGSELYDSIKIGKKEHLLNKKRYIEMSIEYWEDRSNSEHLRFFNDALVHLNERVSKL